MFESIFWLSFFPLFSVSFSTSFFCRKFRCKQNRSLWERKGRSKKDKTKKTSFLFRPPDLGEEKRNMLDINWQKEVKKQRVCLIMGSLAVSLMMCLAVFTLVVLVEDNRFVGE